MSFLGLGMGNSLLETASFLYQENPSGVLTFLGVSVALIFILYYLGGVAKKPELICQDGKFKEYLLNNCPMLNERYYPPLWAFSSHLQTALASLIRDRSPNLTYHREMVYLPDGGQLSLDWLDSPANHREPRNQPIILFLPGLTGDSQTEYIRTLVPIASKFGYRPVVYNNRGRGGVDLLTPKTYCAISYEDLAVALEQIKKAFPDCPIIAAGYSLGGIILGHYLVNSGEKSLVSAALMCSVAWDIHASANSMEATVLNLMLNKYLTVTILNTIIPHLRKFRTLPGIDWERVLQSNTLREFDARLTSKVFGFESVDHYYTAATLKGKLHHIKIPVLCMNAADDMFAPLQSLPLQEIASSSHMAMVVTSRGGHLAFMESFLPSSSFFSERLFVQYLCAIKQIVCDCKKAKEMFAC